RCGSGVSGRNRPARAPMRLKKAKRRKRGSAWLGLRPGVSSSGMREHRLDDLEARDVHRRVHVQKHGRVAHQLLDAEVEHHAVAAMPTPRFLEAWMILPGRK